MQRGWIVVPAECNMTARLPPNISHQTSADIHKHGRLATRLKCNCGSTICEHPDRKYGSILYERCTMEPVMASVWLGVANVKKCQIEIRSEDRQFCLYSNYSHPGFDHLLLCSLLSIHLPLAECYALLLAGLKNSNKSVTHSTEAAA